jgi:NADH-quinone oxidoreductase subunit L
MFVAAGVGAYQAAMFHLFTHAFFKALLFLGAGSVIHGMHHEQDMRRMGGLARFLPVTFAAMTIGNIAITGLGIPGLGGFSGFYSKDAILETAFANGQAGNGLGYFGYIVGTLVAGLTAFYSWRLAFMTFSGPKHWAEARAGGHDQHDSARARSDHASPAQHETHTEPDTHGHAGEEGGDAHPVDASHPPHESPWTMLVPLVVLSIGAIAAGVVFMPFFVGDHQSAFWNGSIFTGPGNRVLETREHLASWVPDLPLAAAALGTLAAAYYYLWKIGLPKRIAERAGPLYIFFYNKWFFDEVYQVTFVRGAKALGDLLWTRGDVATIDKLGPNGFAWLSARFAGVLGRFQSGLIYHYAFVMLLGLAGLLSYALWAWVR